MESEWGTHPLSKDFHNKRYANNLSLVRANYQWNGKIQKYNNTEYKAYPDWTHYKSDYSDMLVFYEPYYRITRYKDIRDQIKQLSTTKEDPYLAAIRLESLIEVYELI